jgi:hypothetical protein
MSSKELRARINPIKKMTLTKSTPTRAMVPKMSARRTTTAGFVVRSRTNTTKLSIASTTLVAQCGSVKGLDGMFLG